MILVFVISYVLFLSLKAIYILLFRVYESYMLHYGHKATNIKLIDQKAIYKMTLMKLLKKLKARRLALGLKQSDMEMRIGLSRQQYQRIESKGNPRLDTLELIAKGLDGQLVFIADEDFEKIKSTLNPSQSKEPESLLEDPWDDLL